MIEVIISRNAVEDLAAHREYLEFNAGARIANKVAGNIRKTIDSLSIIPQQGGRCATSPSTRFRPCSGNAKRYLIYYEEHATHIEILRIIRAEQQSQRDTLGDVGE